MREKIYQHSAKRDLTIDQELALAPTTRTASMSLSRSSFAWLPSSANGFWGYIEIDRGGKANKIKTHERLEGLSLRGDPVYTRSVTGGSGSQKCLAGSQHPPSWASELFADLAAGPTQASFAILGTSSHQNSRHRCGR